MSNELVIQIVGNYTNVDIFEMSEFLKEKFKDKALFQEMCLYVLTENKSEFILPFKKGVILKVDDIISIKKFLFVFNIQIILLDVTE